MEVRSELPQFSLRKYHPLCAEMNSDGEPLGLKLQNFHYGLKTYLAWLLQLLDLSCELAKEGLRCFLVSQAAYNRGHLY